MNVNFYELVKSCKCFVNEVVARAQEFYELILVGG